MLRTYAYHIRDNCVRGLPAVNLDEVFAGFTNLEDNPVGFSVCVDIVVHAATCVGEKEKDKRLALRWIN